MRDILLVLIILGSIPLIFWRPWTGILVWSWIGYMNPHRLTWGFAYDMPFAMIVGIITILAFVIKGEKKLPLNGTVGLVALYTAFTSFTLLFALVPDEAFAKWDTFVKIQLMTFVALFLINDRYRLTALVWVIVLSLGFYGVKGGLFTLIGSEGRVWGPAGSFIRDNNSLALALVMTLPLMRFLQLSQENVWVHRGLLAAMLVTVFAVLGTFSRGGFLALSGMGFYLMMRSRRRVTLGIAAAAAIVVAIQILPQTWFDRMETMLAATEPGHRNLVEAGSSIDASVSGRFDAWIFAVNVANDRPLVGGGFGVFGNQRLFDIYNPEAARARSAHSIWFEVIGEHGWLGFAIFIAIWISVWRQLNRVRARVRNRDDLLWLGDLNEMVRVALLGFAFAGTFLNLATFDLFWHLVAIAVICDALSRKAAAESGEIASDTIPDREKNRPVADPATRPAGGGLSGYLAD